MIVFDASRQQLLRTKYSFKQKLCGSVAAVTLGMAMMGGAMISKAQAQWGGMGVQGLVDGDSKMGALGNVVLPLSQDPLGMFYTTLQGGRFQGENVASLGFGYRAMLGGWMAGGYVSGDLQGFSDKKRLWGMTVGGEVVLGNGLGFGLNLYIPVKKEQTQPGTGHAPQAGLYDQPGSTNCSNPTSTDNKQCSLMIQGQKDNKRVALRGGDINLSYRLPFFGNGLDVVPQGGVYMFEDGIKGWQGGVEITAGLGGGWMITGGGRIRHDRRGTEKILTAGLQVNFGGSASTSTYLQRRMNQAPRRLTPGMTYEEKQGEVYGQQQVIVEGPGGVAVSRVEFVDGSNEGNAARKVANIGNGGMVIFSGNITAPNGQAIEVKQGHVALIGGGTALEVRGAKDGQLYNLRMPGTRPTITQTDTSAAILLIDQQGHTVIQGLDLKGGGNNLLVRQSNNTKIWDVNGSDAGQDGIVIENSVNSQLIGVNIHKTGGRGIYVDRSDDTQLKNVMLTSVKGHGLEFVLSDNANLYNIGMVGVGLHGVVFQESHRALLTNVSVDLTGGNGFAFYGSTYAQLTNVTSSNAGFRAFDFDQSHYARVINASSNQAVSDGFVFCRSDHIELENLSSQQAGSYGIVIYQSQYASLTGGSSHGSVKEGLWVKSSDYVRLNNIVSNDAGYAGIGLAFSNYAEINNVTSNRAAQEGLAIYSSDQVKLSNVSINQSGKDGVYLTESKNAQLTDVTSQSAGGYGLHFEESDHAKLTNVISNAAGMDGVLVNKSHDAQLTNVTSNDAGLNGITVAYSDRAQLTDVTSNNASDIGVILAMGSNAKLTNVTSNHSAHEGIGIFLASDIELKNVTANQSGTVGLAIGAARNVKLSDIHVQGNGQKDSVGIQLMDAGSKGAEISFQNVTVENTNLGFEIDNKSSVKDLKGNKAVNVKQVCDAPDAAGSISVNSGGVAHTCR